MTASPPAIRAEHVGSLLRPPELLAARTAYQAGQLPEAGLRAAEDRAARENIALQRDAGIGVFTDGEVRRDTWMASLRESIGGTVPTTHLTGGQTAAWHRADGDPPREETSIDTVAAAEKVYRKDNRTLAEAAFLREHAPGPFKVTMISASMGATIWHPAVSAAAYPTPGDLIADLVALQAEEAAELIGAGTRWLQLDSLGYTRVIDERFRATAGEGAHDPSFLLDRTLRADKAIVARIRATDPAVTIGLHMCRGNNRSAWMLEGSYEPVAERLFGELDVDRFLLEYDTERAGDFAPLRFIPAGRVVVLGLVSSKSPALEPLDDLKRRVEEASRYVDGENLAISPQCGFASTSAGNLLTADDQRRKLELVATAAEQIWGLRPNGYDWPVSKKNSPSPAQDASAGRDSIDEALDELWAVIESGSVLDAEVQVAGLLVVPRISGASAREAEEFVGSLIAAAARRPPLSSAAAFCRVLISLGSRNVRKMASGALRELTASGAYPPGWVTEIGKPAPGEAWRRYDVFGDDEVVVMTFSYGEARHGILVMIDRTVLPTAITVGISSDPDQLIEGIRREGSEVERAEQISLALARQLAEPALTRAASATNRGLSTSSATFLPVAHSHVRRLPEPEPGGEAGEAREYTAADRAAAVDAFLASPQAADAGDPEVARFWAQALTGYSGRLAGEPPAQVGPRKLLGMLGHVASTFELTDAQRTGFRPAVTGWVTWAAAHQGLDEAATEKLLASVPKALDEFDAAYDDQASASSRAYVSDLATSDADVRDLAAAVNRRSVAIPFPSRGDGTEKADITDVASPAARAARVTEEFGDCGLEAGQTREELLAAATRVVEELWSGEPAATWDAAQGLLATGRARHDVIHALSRQAR